MEIYGEAEGWMRLSGLSAMITRGKTLATGFAKILIYSNERISSIGNGYSGVA